MTLTRDSMVGLVATLEYLQEQARSQSSLFEGLQSFCLFVGYPKSGHSLIGALLDAHPDMVVAHELDCLRFLRAGFGRELIFSLLLEMSAAFSSEGHSWNGYAYSVAGQWQGKYRSLRVLGDKKGGATTRMLLQHPDLLDRLYATVRLPVKWIHVTRNPVDNIAGICRQHGPPPEQAAEVYFSLARAVAQLKTRIPPSDFFEIQYESFSREPQLHLSRLCSFLGQESEPGYLNACAAIVRPARSTLGDPKDWPPGLAGRVRQQCGEFDFLRDYATTG